MSHQTGESVLGQQQPPQAQDPFSSAAPAVPVTSVMTERVTVSQNPVGRRTDLAAKLMDTKGVMKMETYHGEKEKFSDFKWSFYLLCRSIDPGLADCLKHIERNLQKDYSLRFLSDAEKDLAEMAYMILGMSCKEDAREYVETAEDSNGFEVWRVLCESKQVRTASALMQNLTEPTFTSSDPRWNLKTWKK